jgi:hypothetical protein
MSSADQYPICPLRCRRIWDRQHAHTEHNAAWVAQAYWHYEEYPQNTIYEEDFLRVARVLDITPIPMPDSTVGLMETRAAIRQFVDLPERYFSPILHEAFEALTFAMAPEHIDYISLPAVRLWRCNG